MIDRCLTMEEMMGTNPVEGCGLKDAPCMVSRVPAGMPATIPVDGGGEDGSSGIDLFSQAYKALAERSPFDVLVSAKEGGGSEPGSTSVNFPAALAGLLVKYVDSRRRHKKSHSGMESKKKSSVRQNRGRNLWVETEEYFRDLKLSDIETLFELSKFPGSSFLKYLSIPAPGHLANGLSTISVAADDCGLETAVPCGNVAACDRRDEELVSTEVRSGSIAAIGRDCEELVPTEVISGIVTATGVTCEELVPAEVCSGIVGRSDEEIVVEKGLETEVEMEMERKLETCGDRNDACHEKQRCSPPQPSPGSSVSVEWVLGSKNKILLASERPNKKRKLLGEDAGLEKVIVGRPCQGNPKFCHVCCRGDNGSDMAYRLIVCKTCGVAVHRKCYGVGEDAVESSWLCSWCRHINGSRASPDKELSIDNHPCSLCPRKGGALKPLKLDSNGDHVPVKFAHLFCSQWMPEVFVEDTKLMEPILNVDGINETRKRLLCGVCKVKYGACVRCSNGTCRSSFHPICAREASHRIEIWGKPGNDDVELRAFCSKHSDIQDCNQDVCRLESPLRNRDGTPEAMPSSEIWPNGHNELITDCENGDSCRLPLEADDGSKKFNFELDDKDLQDCVILIDLESEKYSSRLSTITEAREPNYTDSVKPYTTLLLKTLIDRGKVNLEEIAMEIGVSPDSLATALARDTLAAETRCKATKWLQSHAFLGSSQLNSRVITNSAIPSGCEEGTLKPDASCVVPVKSAPLRRTNNNVRILENGKDSFLFTGRPSNDEIPGDREKGNQCVLERNNLSKESSHDSVGKVFDDPAFNNPSIRLSTNGLGNETSVIKGQEHLPNSTSKTMVTYLGGVKEGSPYYMHMSIYEKVVELKSEMPLAEAACRLNQGIPMGFPLSNGVCCDLVIANLVSRKTACKDVLQSEQLTRANLTGVFGMAPADDVEGELVYLQHKLLNSKLKRKRFGDDLIVKAVRSLPLQLDFIRSKRWDSVFVNKYLAEVREAKKQGRKEKRHIEAQAVLAAATAAAASSSRISSIRKDELDESSCQEASHMLRPGLQSQLLPRPKEMISRVALPKVAPEKQSDIFQSISESHKESPRSCDICRRPESELNALLICSSCKVAIHLDCYRRGQDFTGPWHCELCEDVASRCTRSLPVNSWEKHINCTECVVCGGTTGAFRKATNSQWIHAFCAEWALQSTYRRGQIGPVEGLESVTMGNDTCCVCRQKKGLCLKCHFGHCRGTFHPTCARTAGLYMNIKSSGSKMQHKAYCERHGSEQKSKDEIQKHGPDELKSVKQIRVELERLRLLCERIVRREKLKRDLLICSHDILASKRDSVAFSLLVRSPFFRPDVSSDSATTSLYNSDSEAIQKSDDVTVDSTISVEKPGNPVGSVENDQRTEDCSTSPLVFARKHTQRMTCAGKKIPHRTLSISRNLSDDGANRSKFRKV